MTPAVRVMAVVCVCLNLVNPNAAQARVRSEIVFPVNGFKLRQGPSVPVRVRVDSEGEPIREWVLSLLGPLDRGEGTSGTWSDGERELARGSQLVPDEVISELTAEGLVEGASYRLRLHASTKDGALADAEVIFLVPDLEYALIPLDPGNFSVGSSSGLALDSTGNVVALGGPQIGDVRIIDAVTGARRTFQIPLGASEGQKLSRDGKRFFFRGHFPLPYGLFSGIGFLELGDGTLVVGPATGSALFSIDESGGAVAFQALEAAGSPKLAYFLYSQQTAEVRQLTTDPDAIIGLPRSADCPQRLGTTPLMSSDGSRVVVVTGATLGVAAEDPEIGCRIFVYQVASDTWSLAAQLPKGIIVDVPTLSDDGRWMSFSARHTEGPGVPRTLGAIADLETGLIDYPAIPGEYTPTFDAVISGDGSKLLLTTLADLDPRVGNADRNVELFMLDREAMTFTQLTDTLGGIGQSSGSCPRYRPRVNRDGQVAAFSFSLFSAELCTLEGPQRNGADELGFGRVRVVRKRVGNRAPVMSLPASVKVRAEDVLEVPVAASDPDDDAIYLFAQLVGGLDVPSGSQFDDHGNGVGALTWPTTQQNNGVHSVRIAAFDEGGGEVFQDIEISVCAPALLDTASMAVVSAIFLPDPPLACSDADINRDGRITAPDITAAVRVGEPRRQSSAE